MALKQDIGIPCNACKSCRGFTIHGWRKFCVDCGCGVERHDITDESTLSILDEMKLFDKQFYSSYQSSLQLASKAHKSWLPVGLKFNEIDEFVSLLPNMCDKGSEERCRKRKLRLQIPMTDRCVEKFCHLDTPSERHDAEMFFLNRNNRDIGLGYITRVTDENCICADCQISLRPNTLSVYIDQNSDSKQFWHPYCFKCSTCQELLVDFIYVSHNHRIYCLRHYAKAIRPRCGACDEIIFSHEYIRANDDTFHSNHFACSICDTVLSVQGYLNYENNTICKNCFDIKFSNKCQRCNEVISCDSKYLSYKDSHWHEACFTCCICYSTVVEKDFDFVNSKIYCENCHREHNLPRCDFCFKPIDNISKIMENDGKKIHADCVLCDECKNPIGVAPFIIKDSKRICMPCFDNKFGKKCARCNEIVRNGIFCQGLKYHHECFKCSNCSCNVVNTKFFNKNNSLFCKSCYDQLFGVTCAKCTALISAESASKYVKFDDKSWHSECFNCYKCECSVVNKGFIIKDTNIHCGRC